MLQPHQQRALIERDELETKIAALGSFMKTATFLTGVVPIDERERLVRQRTHMQSYWGVLCERIANFTP